VTQSVNPQTKKNNDNVDSLLSKLPLWIREITHKYIDDLEEIAMDIQRPLVLTLKSGFKVQERLISSDDIDYVKSRLERFRSDNRTGIDGTLHRISAIRNKREQVIGLTLRIGRYIEGVADNFRGHLLRDFKSVMLIGPPAVGKTTFLRGTVSILAKHHGAQVVIVDSSNEIAGDGDIPHWSIGFARRLQVPSPAQQPAVLMEALANHSPKVIVVDELGYKEDVSNAVTIVQRGVKMISTVHGKTLGGVVLNPDLQPLLGGISPDGKSRLSPAVFGSALEIRGRGEYYLHENLEASVDDVLSGGAGFAKNLLAFSQAEMGSVF